MGRPPAPRFPNSLSYCTTVTVAVFKCLRERIVEEQNVPLFPNLVSLECQFSDPMESLPGPRSADNIDGIIPCIPHIAGSFLKQVTASGIARPGRPQTKLLASFLSTVFQSYPHIQDLGVVSYSGRPYLATLSDVICGTSNLRAFFSNIPVTPSAVLQLLSMRHLTSITIELPDSFSHVDVAALGSLEKVKVFAQELDTCSEFISSIQPGTLKEIIIQAHGHCTPEDIRRCFGALREHRSLRRISAFPEYLYKAADICLIPGSTLALLYPLAELQSLAIEQHIEVDLYDHDALALSKAWPSLQNLQFVARPESSREYDARAHLTPAGLLHLVENCKNLKMLTIGFDSTINENMLDTAISVGPIAENLVSLGIHTVLSPVREPEKVVHFLKAVFPKLYRLAFCWNSRKDHRWAIEWREISAALSEMLCANYSLIPFPDDD